MALDMLTMAQNTMNAYADAIRILSSNVQNFEVDGYKEVQYNFQSIFSQQMGGPAGRSTQISQSVAALPSGIDFRQGSLKEGKPLNCAVIGQSLMVTQSPHNGQYFYKRNSDYMFDEKGYLIDMAGRRVMGYRVRTDGIVDRSQLVPMKIDINKHNLNDIGFEDGGILTSNFNARKQAKALNETVLPSGTQHFQIALAKFANPNRLAIASGSAYSETQMSGSPIQFGTSNDGNLGSVQGASTEISTINPADVTIQGIQLQRGYNFALSNMNLINRTIQDFVSKIAQ